MWWNTYVLTTYYHVLHGFRKSISCETQIAISLNDGDQLEAALLDFSKAYDKVSHRKQALS